MFGDGKLAGSESSQRKLTCPPPFPMSLLFLSSLTGFYGGAGFSNIFSVPSFQSSAVSAYKSQIGSLNSGKYNANGRGFPDISAQVSRSGTRKRS